MPVTESAWSLEPCRYCDGTAILGQSGKCVTFAETNVTDPAKFVPNFARHVILCENCEAKGMVLMERASLAAGDDDK